MLKEFKKVTWYENMGKSPAKVNLKTGEIGLNANVWPKLGSNEKKFVAYHELGHYKLQTFSESSADSFAIRKMAKEGLPMEKAITAMTKVLDEKNESHLKRVNDVYEQALILKKSNLLKDNKMDFRNEYEGAEASFFGKKARARREARREAKHEQKLEKIAARADGRSQVAASGGNNFMNQVSGILGGILGGGSTNQGGDYSEAPGAAPTDPKNKKDQTILIVGIVVVVVVVGVFIYKKVKG
jgi:hypothetical protein